MLPPVPSMETDAKPCYLRVVKTINSFLQVFFILGLLALAASCASTDAYSESNRRISSVQTDSYMVSVDTDNLIFSRTLADEVCLQMDSYGLNCSRRDEILSSTQTQPTMAYVGELSSHGIDTVVDVTILDARTNTRIGGNAYGIYTTQTIDLLFDFRFHHLSEETEFHVVQVQSYGHRSSRSAITAAANRAVQEFATAYSLRRDFTRWQTPPK